MKTKEKLLYEIGRSALLVLLSACLIFGSGATYILTAVNAAETSSVESSPTPSKAEATPGEEATQPDKPDASEEATATEKTEAEPPAVSPVKKSMSLMSVPTDPSWTPGATQALVMNDTEFQAALKNTSITEIYFGADITLAPTTTNRYQIPTAKTDLTIDGTDPRTGTRYKLTYPNTNATNANTTIRYDGTTSAVKNFEFRNVDIDNYNYYGIFVALQTTNYATVTFNSVHYEGTQLIWGSNLKLVFKSDDADEVNYFNIGNQLPGTTTSLQEVAECAAVEFKAGRTEMHHVSTGNSTFWMGQRTDAWCPGQFQVDTGADVYFDTKTSPGNNRGMFYIDNPSNSNVQFPIVVQDDAKLEMLIGGCLCYSTTQQQAIRGLQVGKNSQFIVNQQGNTALGSGIATLSMNGDLTAEANSRVVITNKFTSGTPLLFRGATNKIIVDNPRSFIVKNNGNNLISYTTAPTGTGQFQAKGAGVHYYTTYYDESDRNNAPTYFWEINRGATPISVNANLNTSGAPTSVTTNYTGPLAVPSNTTFNPSTARVISVGEIDMTVNGPIYTTSQTLTGTATPGSTVTFDFSGAYTGSVSGVADASGNYSITLPKVSGNITIPAGTTIKPAANLDYRTRKLADDEIPPLQNLGYKVNYYKDSTSGTLLGSSTAVPDQVIGSTVTLAGGTGNAQLDAFRPSGYNSGTQQGTTTIAATPNPNIINVVYTPKTDISYTVEYYKNDLTPGSKIGTSTAVTGQTGGTGITLAGGTNNAQLDSMRPSGYKTGVQQGTVPYVLGDSGNVIKVLYEKRIDLSYTVEYYKDDLTPGNKIGTSSAVTNQTAEDQITLASGAGNAQLDSMKPAGYQNGVQQGVVPYVIGDNPNVIKVLYTARTDISYIVKYYAGPTMLSASYVGQSSAVTGQTGGTGITLSSGTGNAQLDSMKPSGYLSGVQQGTVPYILEASGNEISVLYVPKTDLTYTIRYYVGSVAAANEISGSATIVNNQTGGAGITLGALQLDAYRPSGYLTGVQQGAVPYIMGDDPNTINVVYSPKVNLSYTVEYYKDDLTTGNRIGTSTAVINQIGGTAITLATGTGNAQLNAMRPSGYQDGIQQDAPFIMGDDPNVIKVLYTASTSLFYTVEYYRGDLTPGSKIGTSSQISTTGGSLITLESGTANGQLNAMRPSGFANGVQQGTVPYAIGDTGNVIKVLYEPLTNLSYTVEYYKGDLTPGNRIGTSSAVTNQTGGSSVTLPAGTGNAQLNAMRPAGYQDGIQQDAPFVIGDNPNVIKVLYTAKTNVSYTVEYYKNDLTIANRIGTSSAVTNQTGGASIALGAGTGNAQLNAMRPSGYLDGIQQDAPFTLGDDPNVIKVLYAPKTNLTYTVQYYKDFAGEPTDLGYYLGASTVVASQVGGTGVTLAGGTGNAQLDAYKPAGYVTGIQQGAVPYIMGDDPNVIKVLYSAATSLSYTVNYYKGSITNPSDTLHFIGSSSPVTGITGGTQIMLNAGTGNAQLNAMRPSGYQNGVQDNAPYTVVIGTNTINVLYSPKTNLSYTVEYYKDSVTTPGDASHYLGTSNAVTSQIGEAPIALASGTGNAQLDALRPSGFNSGLQQGAVPYIITNGTNTIDVLYTPKTNLSYTVEYYKDSATSPTDSAHYLGTSTAVTNQTGGSAITLVAGTGNTQLNAFRPSGYDSGIQQGGSAYIMGDDPNVIKVLYRPRTDLTYKVEYYKDIATTSSDSDHYLGSSTVITGQTGGTPITLAAGAANAQLNAFLPAGYLNGIQVTSPFVLGDDPNVIKVYYPAATSLSYTVNYYKGSVTNTGDSAHFLGSSSPVTGITGGTQITLPGGAQNAQLDMFRPSGYSTGAQQNAPYTVIVGTNTINVLYTPRTDLSYTVEYYKDSVTNSGDATHYLGSSTAVVNQTGGSQIFLGSGAGNAQLEMKQPLGYSNGVQQGTVPYIVGDNPNVIKVLYTATTGLSYTVRYYKNAVTDPSDTSNYLGSSATVTGVLGGTGITLTSGTGNAQLDALRPGGFNTGLQQGTTPYVITNGTNTIDVLYTPKTNLSYTVEYYKDSATSPTDSSHYLGSSTTVTPVTGGQSILLATGTNNAQLDAFRPSGYASGIQQGGASYTIGDDPNVIKVLYRPRTDLTYKVEYYKDIATNSSDTSHYLGTSTAVANQTGGMGVMLTAGTANAQLDAFQPAGYLGGVQVTAPYVMGDDPNVIKVYYPAATSLSYTVRYYKGMVTNPTDGAHYLGEASPVTGITGGTQITLPGGAQNAQLDMMRPSGYSTGIQQDAPHTVIVGTNTINVVYTPRTDLSYTVEYYKDSVTNSGDATHYLGSSTAVVNQTGGSQIFLASGTSNAQLDAKQPLGYSTGVQQGTVPYVMGDQPNVIKVLYTATTGLSYTVRYYKNAVTDPSDTSNYLGSSSAVTGVIGGTQISLGAGTGNAQLDMLRPGGFTSGVQQGVLPYLITNGSNTIDVLYTAKTNLSYTVEYYKDSATSPADSAHYLGTSSAIAPVTGGSLVLLGAGTNNAQLDAFRPSGYASGIQQGGASFTIGDDPNVIKVLYRPRTDLSYTVEYYKNDLTAGNKIGTSNPVTGQVGATPITLSAGTANTQLNAFRPSGYLDGVQQSAPFVLGDDPNVIKVLYAPKTNLTYTVEYYKDDLSSAPIGTSSVVTSQIGGTGITIAGGTSDGQLDYRRPAGYSSGVQQGTTPYIMGDDPNTIKVLYTATTGLSYTVEYYKDDLTAGNKIGTSNPVSGLIGGTPITLATGTANAQLDALRPSGYVSGVQQGTTPHIITGTDDVIKVLYAPKTNLTYEIRYYKGAVSPANEIPGSVTTATNQVGGTGITLGTLQLDAFRPSGYMTGVQQDTVPYIVGDDPNVINVVYTPKTTLSYTVEYYHDSISSANLIGSSTPVTAQTGGMAITLTPGSANAQLDAMKPSGYFSGIQQGAPTILGDDPNVIKVLYAPKTTLSYTIEYYKDTLATGNLITTSSAYTNQVGGTGITLGPVELSANRPSGYMTGVQQGTVPYVIKEDPNVIKVLFLPRTDLTYTVEYYKDSLSTTPIGTSNVIPNQTGGSLVTLAAGTSNGQLDFLKPSGYQGGIQQGAPFQIGDGPNVIKVLYTAQNDLTYTVEYYKDNADNTANKIGTSLSVPNNTTGDQITLAAGTGNAQLDAFRPSGYASGVQHGSVPYTIAGGTNVIKVVYAPRTDLTYTVKYYRDSVSAANEIDDSATTISGQVGGSKVTLQAGTASGQLDAFRPSGFKSGIQQDTVPYAIGDGPNTINVVYAPKTNLTYKIEYYKDSLGAANYITTSAAVTNQVGGTDVTLGAAALDMYRPTGYDAGVQQEAPYAIGDDPNTIKVLYVKKTNLSYTVEYYKDSLASGNLVGTSSAIGGQTFGSQVTLAGGTADGQLDHKLAAAGAGYKSGVQQGTVPYVILDGTNTIKVLYVKDQVPYTINYYCDSVAPANLQGTDTVTGSQVGTPITLGLLARNAFRPASGYGQGVQQGTVPYVLSASSNTIDVVYSRKSDLTYKVEYYRDYVSGNNLVGTSSTVSSKTYGDLITLADGTADGQLDYKKPAGYNTGEQDAPTPYMIQDATNTIRVIYTKKTDLKATVRYWQDAVGTGTLLGTDQIDSLVYGSTVILPGGSAALQLDHFKPEGYKSGVQQNAPHTVIDGTNTIDVLHTKRNDLEYIVEYRMDAPDGELIGTSSVKTGQTFGANIALRAGTADGMLDFLRPVGYQTGIQTPNPHTIVEGDNTIVVYYPKRTDISLKIRYYSENLDGTYSLITTVSRPNNVLGDPLSLASSELNAYKPVGFGNGVVQGNGSDTIEPTNNVVDVRYPRLKNLKYTVKYYRNDAMGAMSVMAAGTLIKTVTYTDQTFGTKVTLTKEQLNAYKPASSQYTYSDGTASPASITVGVTDSANVFEVTYARANTAPVVEASKVLHLTKGLVLSQTDFLKAIGARAYDKEDGTYPLSRIQITGWSNIKWDTVNYPGSPYVVKLQVADSQGKLSSSVAVAVFIRDKNTPLKPVDPNDPNIPGKAPAGYQWGKDADGNYVLYPISSSAKKAPVSFSAPTLGNVQTGDDSTLMLLVLAFTAVTSVGIILFLFGSRKRREEPDAAN